MNYTNGPVECQYRGVDLRMTCTYSQKMSIEIAIVGTGGMAENHLRNVAESSSFHLCAVCDIDPERAALVGQRTGVPHFTDHETLFDTARPQAVIVATPHLYHPPIAMSALRSGIHVLVEKPIAVQAADASEMIGAYDDARRTEPGLVFAAVFMLRTVGCWRKVKELIDRGDLGRLLRASWIVTDWFRTQKYYDTGGWRATWKGEGGGVLLNQAHHNLDLYQWFFGMPSRVHGFAPFGKYHTIEVEDEATAVFEHSNGMIGHFVTSTAESPGTNRLEVAGELGRLVVEDGRVTFDRNDRSLLEVIERSEDRMPHLPFSSAHIPVDDDRDTAYVRILENFSDAIDSGAPLIAPAPEGYGALSLTNAVVLSSARKTPVDLPLDESAYAVLLRELIEA